MKNWLFSSYQYSKTGNSINTLSIFITEPTIDESELESDIVSELAKLGPIHALHIVGFPDAVKALKNILHSPKNVLMERFQSVVGNISDGLLFISLDTACGKHNCEDSKGQNPINNSVLEYERQYSLLKLFLLAGGEERAPTGTHYAKTSARHSDRFLRVANVLEDGRHVKLLAFWLVPYLWNTNIQHIAVDTSGIYSVALTALRETAKLGGLTGHPSVWSFKSHEGIEHVPLEIAKSTLFLISTSTSNGLFNRATILGVPPEKIITLFCLSPESLQKHVVLCNLNGINGDGLQYIENHNSDNCTWCKQKFHLIAIRGDQFSVSPPNITLIEIVAADLPPAAKNTLSALMGLGVFYAYRRIDNNRLCSLGVKTDALLDGEPPEKSKAFIGKIREKWSSILRRSQTISLRNIVATTYPGSTSIAEKIFNTAHTKISDNSQIQVVPSAKLREIPAIPGTSSIVVAACVDEIQELLSVSRNLRDVQEGGSTSYISVIQMLAPKKVADRLKSNLTYGALGADTFSSLCALELEVDCYEDAPSWGEELSALRKMVSWADKKEYELPLEIEKRIERLTKAVATGLIDDLYWPNMMGQPLTLRSDFALLNGALQQPCASQADLFATMCTLLTALRVHKDGHKRLAHNSYERSVLAPSNFSRFNDGVLQASILRASKGNDLAYGACDEAISQQMLDILLDTVPNVSRPERSEALVEFLLALLTKRMTLLHKHLHEFLANVVTSTEETWSVAYLLARFIQDEFQAS